jgi:hypothetical protein
VGVSSDSKTTRNRARRVQVSNAEPGTAVPSGSAPTTISTSGSPSGSGSAAAASAAVPRLLQSVRT